MANVIKVKRGLSADLSKANLQAGEIAFTTDTKKLYISSTDEPINNNTTYAISKSGSTITLTGSDGSTTTVTDSNTTYSDATTSKSGLMTAAMVTKLNGIATGANKTTVDSALSSTSTNPVQNKIIYAALAEKVDTNTTYSISKSGSTVTLTGSDGSTSTFTDANTTYSNMTAATSSAAGKAGLVPAPAAGKQTSFLRGDGTWVVPTNTTYNAATTSAAGLMSAADKTKLDGIATGANNYTYTLPTASSSTLGGVKTTSTVTSNSGYTACPIISGVPYYKDTNTTYTLPNATASTLGGVKIGSNITVSSGTISLTKDNVTGALGYTPPTTNTTYNAATTSAAGLMSAADKTKLDGIATGANNYILPAATTVLGGVKTTSTVTSTSGLTACPIIDGTVYYKDTNTTYSVATQSANGLMSANDKKALDGMAATTTTPKAAGTAAVGSETKYARGDHVHPAQTTVSGNAGSATKWATARTLTIGKTGKSVNGTANVSWSLDEIGSNVYVGTTAPTDADVDVWVDPTGSVNLSALWNSIYPVGSIYMSTSSTNPKDLFTGTTWSQITDRFLVAMGSTYKTAGGTGGASSVTLATGNLPSHSHSVSITTGNQSAGHTHSIPALSGTATSAGTHNHLVTSKTTSYGSGSQTSWRCLSWSGTNADWSQNVYSGDSGAHTHDVTTTASTTGGISANHTHSVSGNTGSQGSGTAFSIIPPYYAVYMWRRTA